MRKWIRLRVKWDDPKRADLVKQIFRLTELAAEMRRAFNEALQ